MTNDDFCCRSHVDDGRHFQKMALTSPHDHWIDKRVDVSWSLKMEGIQKYDMLPYRNKLVLSIIHVLGQEYLAVLEGHLHAPVRIERLTESTI